MRSTVKTRHVRVSLRCSKATKLRNEQSSISASFPYAFDHVCIRKTVAWNLIALHIVFLHSLLQETSFLLQSTPLKCDGNSWELLHLQRTDAKMPSSTSLGASILTKWGIACCYGTIPDAIRRNRRAATVVSAACAHKQVCKDIFTAVGTSHLSNTPFTQVNLYCSSD
jgi:hypothetical protein